MTQLLSCALTHPLPFSDWSTPQWASFVELKAAEEANLRLLSACSPAVLAIIFANVSMSRMLLVLQHQRACFLHFMF
jgi:transcriptional regulator of acetoin/glycerol metabolism